VSTNKNGGTSGLVAEDINPQPVSALKQGGTIVWSLDEYSPQWNYGEIDGAEASVNSVMGAIMPMPMISDDKANVTANPNYLTSISETSSSPQTIVAQLNPKAVWSDGAPITAADYVANLTVCDGKHKGYNCASNVGENQIASATATSKYGLKVVFSKPFSDWKALFNSYFYPAKEINTADKFNKSYAGSIPVTGGPFGNPQLNKSAQTVTVTPNPKWWGPKPMLSKIVFKAETSTAANQAFVNGELDYDFDVAVDPADYKQVKQATNGVVTLAAGPDYRQITVNSTHGFMKDEKVRQAVAMGIDRDAIIKSDLSGIPWPIIPLNNHFYMNSQSGYQDDTGNLGTYNPDGAKKLLESDGFTMSNGLYTKNGTPITLSFMIPAGIASSKNEGELVQAMMQQIGIKVNIKSVPVNDWSSKWLVPGKFDLAPFSWLGTPFPVSSSLPIYQSPKNGGGENFTGTANSQVDDLLNQAVSSTDPSQTQSLTLQADKLLYQEVHTITLFQRPQMCGVTKGIANLGSFGFATPDYTKIGYMKNA